MSKTWPLVKLGEVMGLSDTAIPSTELSQVNLAGVYSFGRGLFARGLMSPRDTSYKTYNRLVTNDFVISQPKAWEGALARVTPEFNGWYLSPVFPTFRTDRDKLDPAFLEWFCKRQNVWMELQRNSRGIGARRETVSAETFLALQIPLPPLAEQQRIVANVERLAGKIEEARKLRTSVSINSHHIWNTITAKTFEQLSKCYCHKKFSEVCEVVRGGSPRPAGSPIYYEGTIPFLKVADLTADDDIYLHSYTSTIKEAGLSKTRLVIKDTLMLTNSGATLGVPKICCFETTFNDGIQAFLGLPSTISKEYLYYFLASKTNWFRNWAARGQGQPNLNTGMVKALAFPSPPLEKQLKIVNYLNGVRSKIQIIRSTQSHITAELDAMLPSILDKAFKGQL